MAASNALRVDADSCTVTEIAAPAREARSGSSRCKNIVNVPAKGTHADCEAKLTPAGPSLGSPGVVVVVAALDRVAGSVHASTAHTAKMRASFTTRARARTSRREAAKSRRASRARARAHCRPAC